MAEKADPESGSSGSESPGSVWRVRREEVPLSRGESGVILGERVRKREKPRKKRQTESQTLTGTLGKNEVRASQHGFQQRKTVLCCVLINGWGHSLTLPYSHA